MKFDEGALHGNCECLVLSGVLRNDYYLCCLFVTMLSLEEFVLGKNKRY